MTYASEFELIASLIAKDRFFMEVDEHGVGELLTKILRTCHDYSNSNAMDADQLASEVAGHILDYTADGDQLVLWPEMEGDGPQDWEKVDAEHAAKQEAAREARDNPPMLQPGELDPETGLYNPNEHPEPRVEPVKADGRKLSAVPTVQPVPRDLPPLEGLEAAGV